MPLPTETNPDEILRFAVTNCIGSRFFPETRSHRIVPNLRDGSEHDPALQRDGSQYDSLRRVASRWTVSNPRDELKRILPSHSDESSRVHFSPCDGSAQTCLSRFSATITSPCDSSAQSDKSGRHEIPQHASPRRVRPSRVETRQLPVTVPISTSSIWETRQLKSSRVRETVFINFPRFSATSRVKPSRVRETVTRFSKATSQVKASRVDETRRPVPSHVRATRQVLFYHKDGLDRVRSGQYSETTHRRYNVWR